MSERMERDGFDRVASSTVARFSEDKVSGYERYVNVYDEFRRRFAMIRFLPVRFSPRRGFQNSND